MLTTALTTALPPIITDLGITVELGQWLTSAYSLAMGIIMPLTAFLITRVRTKRLYLAAILLFVCGSMLCVFAPNYAVMMIGRILQAFGNGILLAMSQVVLMTIYPISSRGRVMGWYGLSVGAVPVLAPSLAGVLIDHIGWRWVFIIPMAIMLIVLIAAALTFDDVLDTSRQRFDLPSFMLSALAFGGLTLGIGNLTAYGIASTNTWPALLIGLITAVAFTVRQTRLAKPFLDVRLLGNRVFRLSVIASMLLYFSMMGSSVILPLYVQNIMKQSATISALVVLPGSLVMALLNPVAGHLFDRFGMKTLLAVGAPLLTASNLGMAFIAPNAPLWVAACWNAARSAAIGCLMMPLVTWGINALTGSGKGTSSENASATAHGSALLTSLRTIAGAIGSAVCVGVMETVAETSRSGTLITGLHMAFLTMTACSALLLILTIGVIAKGDSHA